MNKKTVIIVCVSLVLAIISISVIATFPTYLFEDTDKAPAATSEIESSQITEPTQGDDVADVGGDNGVEGVIPDVNDSDIDLPETPLTNYEVLTESKGAKLLGEINAFPDGTEFMVDKLGIFDKKYYRARHKVRGFAKKYLIYNITAQKDGKDVTPNGIAKVAIDIPENYNLDQTEVYLVLSNGNIVKLDCTIYKSDRTATVTFTQSGVYMLVERKLTNSNNTSAQSQNSSSGTVSSEKTESSNSVSSDSSTSSNPISNDDSSTNSDSSNKPDTSETNTSENDTSDTDTSEPNTSEPDTSEPDTSEPDTSEPDTSEETDPNKDSMKGWTPWY